MKRSLIVLLAACAAQTAPPDKPLVAIQPGTPHPLDPLSAEELSAAVETLRSEGKLTEGNLTFEIPKAAGGLALTYEPPSGAPLRIPLPPEFG